MMNKILQNLINTGKVESFIDNVIVRTEEEKEHDCYSSNLKVLRNERNLVLGLIQENSIEF